MNFKFDMSNMPENMKLQEKLKEIVKLNSKVHDEILATIILNLLEEDENILWSDLILDIQMMGGSYRTYEEIREPKISRHLDSKFSFIENNTRYEIRKMTEEEKRQNDRTLA